MVTIGNVKSINHAESYSYNLDDRQELVKTINGAVVVDPWEGVRNNVGDVLSFDATFSASDSAYVRALWAARQKVTVILDTGETISNARIVVRQIKFIERYWGKYETLTLEIWRV